MIWYLALAAVVFGAIALFLIVWKGHVINPPRSPK
jgi:hypothetical protein